MPRVFLAQTVTPIALSWFGELRIDPLHDSFRDANRIANRSGLFRRHWPAGPIAKSSRGEDAGGDQQNSFATFIHDRTIAYSPFVRYTTRTMQSSFESALIEVWRQALVEDAPAVQIGKEQYSVRRTPKSGLRQVDFVFDGREIRGLEQNPNTKSRWAKLARSGKKVMQFLIEGRYVANVTDGKATLYGSASSV